ncbi:MAG TPA: dolichol kinase [Bacteroidota bacterium]|nr:dolichol kinase [Bacteroidota bacterium]
MRPGNNGSDTFRIELIRKTIHLCSIVIPAVYWYIPKAAALAILFPLTIVVAALDLARYRIPAMEAWFTGTFGILLRSHELDKKRISLSGATYVLLSATLTILIFPKLIAVTSFSTLILCDISAALVGRKFGRHRFFHKSLEGSGAFFLTGILLIAVLPKIEYSATEYLISGAAVACGTAVEALPIPVDDNFSVPLTVGSLLWCGYTVFLPHLNIHSF